MPHPRTSIRHPKPSAQLERHTQRFHELKQGLDQLECFCRGTILKRMMKCGKAQCATDERRLGADLGLYSVTFNNDVDLDHRSLEAY